jgi:hypothetical protein
MKLTRENDLAAEIFERVTEKVHTTVESPKRTRTRVDCVQTMPFGILREAA